jgi:protein-S-isoprenylcysteine O-methyltransferase Ste14
VRAAPPPSVTHYGYNLLGALGALAALALLRARHASGPDAVLAVFAAGVAPIVLADLLVLRVHRRASAGLDWEGPGAPDLWRVLTKLLGLSATVGVIALAYFVFPEYDRWYSAFWTALRRFWPSLVAAAVLYVWFVDGRMREPHDTYWQLGRLLLFRGRDARREDLAQHARAWLIKAFFIPLFVVFTSNQIDGILRYDLSRGGGLRAYGFLTDGIYAIDVLFALAGYCFSLRVLDAHLRSAEPTMLGWVVALECYQPFWGRLSSSQYLRYDGVGFESWLAPYPAIRAGWAAAIVALEAIYLLATFSFGVRFSNLTHRGVLTNGPYRFTKHPAYVAKNLSWWMITLPFVPYHGAAEAVRSTLALAGVSTIYYLRARTEERHLSLDPAYVAYATWIDQHGWLRCLRRVPFLRYAPPPAAR